MAIHTVELTEEESVLLSELAGDFGGDTAKTLRAGLRELAESKTRNAKGSMHTDLSPQTVAERAALIKTLQEKAQAIANSEPFDLYDEDGLPA